MEEEEKKKIPKKRIMIKRMTRRIRRKRERRVRRCTENRFVSLDYFVRGEPVLCA
jgi:hypothetical protein